MQRFVDALMHHRPTPSYGLCEPASTSLSDWRVTLARRGRGRPRFASVTCRTNTGCCTPPVRRSPRSRPACRPRPQRYGRDKAGTNPLLSRREESCRHPRLSSGRRGGTSIVRVNPRLSSGFLAVVLFGLHHVACPRTDTTPYDEDGMVAGISQLGTSRSRHHRLTCLSSTSRRWLCHLGLCVGLLGLCMICVRLCSCTFGAAMAYNGSDTDSQSWSYHVSSLSVSCRGNAALVMPQCTSYEAAVALV